MGYTGGITGRGSLGSLTTTALVSTASNVLVPGSGPIVAVGATVLNSLFGSNQDAARLAREQWFEQAAKQGSVLAARILIGGTLNTASHEIPYYQAGIQRLLADPSTSPTMREGQAEGAYWDTTDNATSDKMRGAVENELEQLGAGGAPALATSPTSSTPAVRLPAVVSNAPYNWVPLAIGIAAALGAVVILPRIVGPSRRA